MSIFDIGDSMAGVKQLMVRIAVALEGINDSLAEILERIDQGAGDE